jgi:hypothetical protein
MKLSDIRRLTWENAIRLARDGDGHRLVPLLLADCEIPPFVREFLADVVAGKTKLKRRKRRQYSAAELAYLAQCGPRYLVERRCVEWVRSEMLARGRQRDKTLRTALIREWCEREKLGITYADVDRYMRLPKKRREEAMPIR